MVNHSHRVIAAYNGASGGTKNTIASKNCTEVLINEVKPVDSKTPEGYILSVEILGDAIQSLPTKAVESSWNVTVDTNGHISK